MPPQQHGAAATATTRPHQDFLGCLLAPSAEVELGSQVIGVLSKVAVERGDHVKKGQVVAQLIDDVERASYEAAAQRAANSADIASARSAYEFAQKKADRAEELLAKNFISSQARDQAVSEAKVAAMHYAQTQEARVVARQDMGVAKAQLNLRTITSPFNGVVVERYMSAGTRVEEKPIVKLVQIDPLRVEVVAPAARFNTIKSGSYASVTPDLPGMNTLRARVTEVDAVVDAASNTFRVRLELPNPQEAVPSGLRCKINFDSDSSTGEE
ncbi:MAG TPA: efflux RND transporter periplasmic adaptor subunit [Rhodocyclaceae bacterium]|nr:efflux RND transporter periplasmic adaptor subunit [Rhodocyclaceae bacterium]